jgi:hypothetical protein
MSLLFVVTAVARYCVCVCVHESSITFTPASSDSRYLPIWTDMDQYGPIWAFWCCVEHSKVEHSKVEHSKVEHECALKEAAEIQSEQRPGASARLPAARFVSHKCCAR